MTTQEQEFCQFLLGVIAGYARGRGLTEVQIMAWLQEAFSGANMALKSQNDTVKGPDHGLA